MKKLTKIIDHISQKAILAITSVIILLIMLEAVLSQAGVLS
jgi:hypothetical protein